MMLLVCFNTLSAQSVVHQLKSLEADFMSVNWPTVNKAKEGIENMGSAAITDLISMMNECQTIRLNNTGDLIYPGAERFFGHGQIIDYDIDNSCIRAGWLLEEITFMNFGFSGSHLPADELEGFIERNFKEYMAVAENQDRVGQLDETGKRSLICNLSIENARKWWQNSSKQWNRLNALEQALNSNDEKCQVKALFYLRNGVTSCKGLTQKYYKSKLSKVVEKLSKSPTGRVSENAKLILLDSDFTWLVLKPVV